MPVVNLAVNGRRRAVEGRSYASLLTVCAKTLISSEPSMAAERAVWRLHCPDRWKSPTLLREQEPKPLPKRDHYH